MILFEEKRQNKFDKVDSPFYSTAQINKTGLKKKSRVNLTYIDMSPRANQIKEMRFVLIWNEYSVSPSFDERIFIIKVFQCKLVEFNLLNSI